MAPEKALAIKMLRVKKIHMRYYEDIQPGEIRKLSNIKQVTRDEVIGFARQFDPQPFHLDDEAAAQTHFGRISASGWHTAAMTMRLLVDDMAENEQAGLGSPGVDNLRWIKPVYPGDTLRCEVEILSKRRSKSRPDMGIFQTATRVFNQNDELVMEMQSNGLISVRDPDAPIED